MLRQHHKAHADSRGNGLGKCSHINHTAAPVHALQRRNRLSLVSEFTVIIILNQIPVRGAVCPGQQLLPPLHRHDNSRGILMGGHHIGHIRSAPGKPFHIHAITVHIHRNHRISLPLKHPVGLLISGIFHGDSPSVSQNLGQQHQKIFASCADENLLRPAVHSSGRVKVISYGSPERSLPLGVPCRKHFLVVIHQCVSADFPPCIERKTVQINTSGRKIHFVAILPCVARLHKRASALLPHFHQLFYLTHKITLARQGLYISF